MCIADVDRVVPAASAVLSEAGTLVLTKKASRTLAKRLVSNKNQFEISWCTHKSGLQYRSFQISGNYSRLISEHCKSPFAAMSHF